MIKRISNYFTGTEKALWCISTVLIILSFAVFDRENYLTLCASLTGAASLILNAKGNPLGQALMVAFSIMYGVISYTYAYYGEMITYLGMTAPMAVFALAAWLKNPYNGNKSEVRVNHMTSAELVFAVILSVAVTAVFYFILKSLNTANIVPSTISVTTSFLAVYLTFRRSALYALAYAANDVVLIVLWCMAAAADISYLSVIICFVMFLFNDIYGYINWKKMHKRQSAVQSEQSNPSLTEKA